MTKDEFIKYLKELNITITNENLLKLEQYKEFLIEYNKHTNLTAIKDENSIYLKHFYDSLTINILDIGTGAGFPGMVLAIFNPTSLFVLLDSNNKKTTFLKLLKEKLNLPNVEIVNIRAEEYVRNNFETFDIVTSRAVAELRILAELSIPALKINGLFIPLKSNVEKEEELFNKSLKVLNGKVITKKEFYLPIENSKRTILVIEHFKSTNNIYPRHYDKIIKKNL